MFDYFGVSAATLCSIHCLALPILTIIPIQWQHNHWIDLLFALIGFVIVLKISKNLDSKNLQFALWFSISVILVSALLSLFQNYHSRLIHLGSLGLITAHLINAYRHKTKDFKLSKDRLC